MSDPDNLRRAADMLSGMAITARALQALASECFVRVEFFGTFERFDCITQAGEPSAIRDVVQALYQSRYESLRAEAAKVGVAVSDYPKRIGEEHKCIDIDGEQS